MQLALKISLKRLRELSVNFVSVSHVHQARESLVYAIENVARVSSRKGKRLYRK